MREDMDSMLNQVRSFIFKTDEALKAAQRLGRDGAGQLETTALREIRDDIWALEDRVRAAKWADCGAQQAELANQIDPLMLQVMAKCQQHKDQVRTSQPLLSDIASWCERGTRAYTFVVHELAANSKAPARYSSPGASDSALQGKSLPASRIPAYKSPTKQAKGQAAPKHPQPQPQQQQQQAAAQPPQQQGTGKVQSRIPAPQLARKSLPDANQQGSTPDQTDRGGNGAPATSAAAAATTPASAGDSEARATGGKVSGGIASRIAAFQRTPAAAPAAAAAPSGGVAAAKASLNAATAPAAAAPPSAGPAAAGSGKAGATMVTPVPAAAAAAPPAAAAAPEGQFVPLDLDAADSELLTSQPQQQAQAQAKTEAVQQQQPKPQEQEVVPVRAPERSSHSSSSGSSSSFVGGRGSAGRVTRSLLHLEPSRDDVPLSSAGQLLQQSTTTTAAGAAAAGADAGAPAAAAAATAASSASAACAAPAAPVQPAVSASNGSPAGSRLSAAVQGEGLSKALHLKLPRTGYAADSAPTEAASSSANNNNNEFPEFGPLRSFTPLVSQQVGRSHPFAPSGSSSGFGDRGSLRTSQDISMLLRSGMLMEAALLSSNASRMHVIHDAVSKKPAKAEGEPDVPVVPSRLAVHKRRPWWAQAARVVVGTAAMAVAGAAGAVAAKHHKGDDSMSDDASYGGSPAGRSKGSRQHRRRQQQPLALEEASKHLPYVPLGPAPDASAGCG